MTFESCIIIIAYDTITFDRAKNCFYKQKEKGGFRILFHVRLPFKEKEGRERERVCEKNVYTKLP